MKFKEYEWKVILLNPTQGFRKTYNPTAYNYKDAATEAFRQLNRKGYDDGEFIVVEIVRGRIVR